MLERSIIPYSFGMANCANSVHKPVAAIGLDAKQMPLRFQFFNDFGNYSVKIKIVKSAACKYHVKLLTGIKIFVDITLYKFTFVRNSIFSSQVFGDFNVRL